MEATMRERPALSSGAQSLDADALQLAIRKNTLKARNVHC
jgi:hypothetical protein